MCRACTEGERGQVTCQDRRWYCLMGSLIAGLLEDIGSKTHVVGEQHVLGGSVAQMRTMRLIRANFMMAYQRKQCRVGRIRPCLEEALPK